jgi:putative membrane protein
MEKNLLQLAFPAIVSALLAFVTFLYLRGWLRLRATLPHLVSFMRVAAFLTGIVLVWVAVASPLAGLDHQLLSVHMIQHLLLMALAAPLLLLGAPGPLLLHALPDSLSRGAARRVSKRAPGLALERIVSSAVFCWFAGTLTVIAWHLPAVFELGHHSPWWHGTQHASFFVAGVLFWFPVIRPWPSTSQGPRWSIPLYLFLATLPCDALSAYLVFCDHVVYAPYLTAHRVLGVSALQDQQWAGALMWVSITFIYLVPAVAVIFQLLSGATRRAPVPDATVWRTNPPTTA